jgi:RNA polymerase sigma-70 factor (ECF subfamily)
MTLGELDEDLSGALNQLPASFRDLVMLSAIGDYTYEELAELQLCPVGTIRSRLSRAKEFLRQRLGQLAARQEPVYN